MGCKDCFEKFSLLYLKIINGLLIILSIVILGFGAYMVAIFNTELESMSLSSPVIGTVVLGSALFVFSMFGVLTAIWPDNQCIIGIYIIGTLFLAIGVLGAGASLLSYTEFLENIQAGNLQYELEESILTYQLAVYNDCCYEASFTISPPEICETNGHVFPCIEDVDLYNDFTEFIGNTTCSFFSQYDSLIGPAEEGGCGGGSADQFVVIMSILIEANLQTLGVVNIILGIVIILLAMSACFLFFTEQRNKRKHANEDDEDDEDLEDDEYEEA